MIKLLLPFIMLTMLNATPNFDKQCLACHQKMEIPFSSFYMQYLLNFSSNIRVKEAMFYFLKEPIAGQSMMDSAIIREYGLMPRLKISDETLKSLIDDYVKQYDVKRKLQ